MKKKRGRPKLRKRRPREEKEKIGKIIYPNI